ncbi:MAG TPA: hypothetical protein VKT51_09925 [Candidatus Eremiobacteraceae bacterium]|nr:hypothetical protein [Candidatus Eremiobacteraceae bacterium]
MKITVRFSAVVLVTLVTLGSVACGGKSTFTDKNGNVTTVDPAHHTVTFKDKTGTHTVADSVDARKLGVPIYPGAAVASGSGFHVGQATHGGDVALLTTADSFDKVVAWYDAHMPKGTVRQGVLKTPIGGAATFTLAVPSDNTKRAVMIAGNDHKTTITVTAGTGAP